MTGKFRLTHVHGSTWALAATQDVCAPGDGFLLYRAGERVPESEGSRHDVEEWMADMNRRYAVGGEGHARAT